MDLTYPPEAETFRKEIRTWLETNLPEGWFDEGFEMTPEERKAFQTSWSEKLFDGGATFRESSDVVVDLQGDPDRAGFVQVMQGRTSDPARARELMAQDPEMWATYRPDVLGSVEILHDGGLYTMVLYFTSEAEAREGERKEVPLELRATMAEMGETVVTLGHVVPGEGVVYSGRLL